MIRYLLSTLFLAAAGVFGQAMDGNLVGVVTDPSGAALAKVGVTAENIATGVKTATETTDAGAFRFNNIPAGTYKISASLAGFTTATLQNVVLESNRTATANIRLDVGAVTTTVEVQEAGALIDTTTANVVNTFNARQAERIPLYGVGTGPTALGVINLSLLNAGVSSGGSVGYGTGPSVGGQRPTNNNFMVDGVDNNNRSTTGPQLTVSNEAVAEFTVQQNQFSPEFGNSSGGQFNTIVKSGSNQLHGVLYEYHTNRDLGGIDESFKRQGIRDRAPRGDVNRLGASVGGPIVKNKLFYFGNAEYTPVGFQAAPSGAAFVPTAAGIQMLGSMPGISKTNLDVFKRYVPVAGEQSRTVTVNGREIPVGILRAIGPAYQNNYSYVASGDYNISDRDQLRMRYLMQKQSSITTTGIQLPDFYTPVSYETHLASLTHFHTFSPYITNEFRIAYTRKTDERPVGEYSFPGLDAFPNLQFDDIGLAIGPNSSYPQGNRNNTYQLTENFNWVAGRHSMKMGYQGIKLNISNFFVQRVRGEYIYNTFERYLNDITPGNGQRSVGGFPFVGNNLSHALYFNDEWRVRQNVTLTLGLRYEFIGVPTGSKQQALNAISSVPGLIEFREPKPTYRDFAPRVGLAWSPGGSGKMSIRAGFGMAYDQVYQNLGANSLPPQFFTTINAQDIRPDAPNFLAQGGIPGTVQGGITSAAIGRQRTTSYIPDQVRPYSVQWNLGVQRSFLKDFTGEMRYLGSRGVHLPIQLNLNRPTIVTPQNSLPTFFQRPAQAELDALTLNLTNLPVGNSFGPYFTAGFTNPITAFTPQGNSSYHGLATQVNKRFSKGYQMIAAYTWSHTIDDSTAALNSTVTTPRRPQNFDNLRAERASSALDHRHRFTLSMVYESQWFLRADNWLLKNLVGNWVVSGTYTAQTGSWATFRSAVDSNRNGDNAADRVLVNNNGDPKIGSGVTALNNSRGQRVGYLV
jgi:hypothetical protein